MALIPILKAVLKKAGIGIKTAAKWTAGKISAGFKKIGSRIKGLFAKKGKKLSVNRFSATDPLSGYFESVKPIKGYTDVGLHGSQNSVQVVKMNGQTVNMNAKQFAEYLRNSLDFNGGNIRLISCNTGANAKGFAQQLANQLGVNVLAPKKAVYIWSNGHLTIGQGAIKGLNLGKWKLFKPL